ncbi:MAG: polymer-forming cytoskeletal protein [Kiloniellaceae bacterium]
MFLNIGVARDQRRARADVGAWPEPSGGSHTIIHADLAVTGELVTDGHVEVGGRIEGTINSRTVAVRESGWVEGTILADSAEIRGTVIGSVRANNVTVGKDARVIGNIFHNTLTIEPGAFLDGRRPWRPHIDRKLDSA